MEWSIFLFAIDPKFTKAFTEATKNLNIQNESLNLLASSNFEEYKNQLKGINTKSIFHINMDNCIQAECEELISYIRNNKEYKYIQLIVWMNARWISLNQEFTSKYNINDIRSTENLSPTRIEYIIKVNIINQQNTIDIINLNSNLEEKVSERTKSLTQTNKKLQEYIVTHGNINTKIQQQKIALELQKKEVEERNLEIIRAFKKSSKQHIKMQKLLLENEQNRAQLENAITEIKSQNSKLIAQNEEIKSQRDHIEQQHEEIESQRDNAIEQRDKIVKQQGEIQDNIKYARRIQQALLPTQELINQILPEHFIFNQPKDIVSGDFYWIAQNRNFSVIAVADCTGHGISGALMSMLATGYLNEIVNKNDITCSANILNQLRERIITSLHQQEGEGIEYSHDGLDISICIIDILESKIEFSGANNALYLFRNDELIELKPDKMPIGIHEYFRKPFSKQILPLLPNDTIYLFSDGYADQFGGKNGKKLKYYRFNKL